MADCTGMFAVYITRRDKLAMLISKNEVLLYNEAGRLRLHYVHKLVRVHLIHSFLQTIDRRLTSLLSVKDMGKYFWSGKSKQQK